MEDDPDEYAPSDEDYDGPEDDGVEAETPGAPTGEGAGVAGAAPIAMQYEHIFVSADASEAHYAVHYESLQRKRHSRTRRTSGFVAIKCVSFSNNQQQWVSWCTGCYCGTTSTDRQIFEGGADFSSTRLEDFLGGQRGDLLCACARRIIHNEGGEQQLVDLLNLAAAANAAAAARAAAAAAAAAADAP
jgi:hypothetical protein